MMKLLGIYHSRTTAYHRSANSIVERFHRQLKASLMAANSNSNWLEALLLMLLGVRSTVKEDLHCTRAELVYGTDLSKTEVVDSNPYTATRCMLESWHIQHNENKLNRERGNLPELYAALLD